MRNSLYNVDGVEESQRCDGGLVVEGSKQTIFITLIFFKKHEGGTYIYVYLQEKSYDVCYINRWYRTTIKISCKKYQ